MYNFTEFWMGIQRMVRLYEKMMREVCDGYRLSMVEVDIIAFLKNNPQKDTAADIVGLRMLSKAAVSKGADALIQKGMLEREADPTDRRKIHLKLTKEAFPVTREIQKTQEAFLGLLYEGFSEEEYEMYLRMRARMLRNVSNKTGERRKKHE